MGDDPLPVKEEGSFFNRFPLRGAVCSLLCIFCSWGLGSAPAGSLLRRLRVR